MKISVTATSIAFVFLAASLPAASAQTQLPPTSKQELMVWKTSLRLAKPVTLRPSAAAEFWRGSIIRTGADASEWTERPDVIAVLEVPWRVRSPYYDAADVLAEIRKRLGAAYGIVHVDQGRAACGTDGNQLSRPNRDECGNALIAYNSQRLSVSDTMSWALIEFNGSACERHQLRDQLAVRFTDKLASTPEAPLEIVTAAPHLPAAPLSDPTQNTCVSQNLRSMHEQLEQRWPTRPLTVIAGDFNSNVDPDKDAGLSPLEWRKEDDQSCWYLMMSQAHPGEDQPGCGRPSLPYFDAIWFHPEGGGATNPSDLICDDWTKGNRGPASRNGEYDKCTSTNGRIDFIFVAYEDANGDPVTSSPDGRVPLAGTDKGFYWAGKDQGYQRYSDHRAIYAKFRWCGSADAPSSC